MRQTVFSTPDFNWVDVVDPTTADLEQLAQEFGLHETGVQDSLDPKHLPKFERFDTHTFIIVRAYDSECTPDAATTQELTRKVAIFYGPRFLVSIHRKDQPFVARLRERYAAEGPRFKTPLPRLLADLVRESLRTYQPAMDAAEEEVDRLEVAMFGKSPAGYLEELFAVKRRLALISSMLMRTREVILQTKEPTDKAGPFFQDLRETADALQFRADQLVEYCENVMQLQMALASHRTNEVVKVLTLFSAIFMPITFIVGVYGMNFEVFPELRWPFGYAAVWGVMLAVTGVILWWFRRKGWL